MKHLPKHLQPRYRYLAVDIESRPRERIDRNAFQHALWDSARALHGDTGSAELDLSVLQFDHQDGQGRAVVRTRRGTVQRARSAVATIASVGGSDVGVRVRGVSGTVRACEEKYMSRPPEPCEKRYVAFEGGEQSAVVRGSRVDVRTDDITVGATTLDIE